jgi:hypothetical protein
MARHTHQYTIADDEAVKVLLDKLLIGRPINSAGKGCSRRSTMPRNATVVPPKRSGRHFSTDC